MTLPPFLEQHKKTVGTIVGGVAIIVLGYYLYTSLVQDNGVTTVDSGSNQALLGQDFLLFFQAVTQEKLSLKDTSFLDGYLIRNSEDYTQVITPSLSRGRPDPFTPYATPRSSR